MAIKKLISKRKAKDGKSLIRADSRPKQATTNFTMRGDSDTNIGDGKILTWDFSNSDDIVTDSVSTPIPEGYKRKRLVIKFVDEIWIKEGTLYWENAPFGCYIDFFIVCPAGQYYYDRNGNPQLATIDTPIIHYVNQHRIFGNCYIGDELNTEGAQEDPLPNTYELWIEITTLDSDTTSRGNAELEIYRARTRLLPNESI